MKLSLRHTLSEMYFAQFLFLLLWLLKIISSISVNDDDNDYYYVNEYIYI